jgi:hypothetical protein
MKKLFIGVLGLSMCLSCQVRALESMKLTPEEMSDWRYPAILCRDAVTILTTMMLLEKMIPGGTELMFKMDSEKAVTDTIEMALKNQTTYDNVFDREMNYVDGMRTSLLVWHLFKTLKYLGYKMVDNEKLPLDAFDACLAAVDGLIAPK